jgi:ribosomal protein S18 acetylase RimI-like enzyme
MGLANSLQKSQEIYWQLLKTPIVERGDCKWVDTGIATPWLNGVISADLREENAAAAIQALAEYFDEKKTPFSWWMESSNQPSNFAGEAQKWGIESVGVFEGMILNGEDLKDLPRLENLKIQVVSSTESLRSFVEVLIRSYEADLAIAPAVEELFKKAGLNFPIFHFLGKENGQPVTVGSLFVEGDTAGIYHVGTVPEARNRGYASYLTYTALKHAQYHGCKASFLTSTPMANQIYHRLGYQTVNAFNFYVRMQ